MIFPILPLLVSNRTRVESLLEAISEVLYKHPADGSSQFIDPINKPGAFDLRKRDFLSAILPLSRSHFDAANSSRRWGDSEKVRMVE
ncbi:hypothetical protein CDAR_441501 [Caerostris darwini]|uniref:Uncharacterized protein n=1 Tax=Caerostris darwini TaxID=1538125 RepID=A0AAV4NV65_9ARAC|nr:hypothetical protein CDAR_441501 [Caerostris darwini]